MGRRLVFELRLAKGKIDLFMITFVYVSQMLRHLGNRYLQSATRTHIAMLQSNRAIVVSPFVRFFSLDSKNTNPGGPKPCVDNAELQKLIRTIESYNNAAQQSEVTRDMISGLGCCTVFLGTLVFLYFKEARQLEALSKNQESREED